MFSFFFRHKPGTATIDGQTIDVAPRETILQAALRHGIDFPHSCRVGGCAACKCRLLDGRVRQLTDATYILSDEDLDQHCILACQSIPRGHVHIALDRAAGAKVHRTSAKVIAREHLTHDIACITLQFEQAMPYKAGQFATLAFAGLPGVARSYSLASPPSPDGRARFYVRKVPGGIFSSHAHEAPLLGETVSVEGPHGDFWLRPGEAPLLMVAGGSGLAPIIAMLKACASQGRARATTLVFGARTSRDLYEIDALQSLKAAWGAAFDYTLVLSEEPLGSSWTGARGLVTDVLDHATARDADIYLCGPPAMVDAARHRLLALGAAGHRIRADRFTTQACASS